MKFQKEKIKISVIGLGYVGLPLAVEFSKHFSVTGFDLNSKRILELKNGYDSTGELSKEELLRADKISFVDSERELKESNIYIVTVPTPVDINNVPNLKPLVSASETIAKYLDIKDIIIFESTVFPGCTEEVCVPIIEEKSGKKYNIDFFCGYSPERINPGDKNRTLTKIKKIVSGSNDEIKEFISQLYSQIISAGIYKASSIAVAEAAKVIENTQRDVNIALMNELATIFDKLDLDTKEILNAAGTKWNFLPFRPGLVGGHCIGVDPYYLTHKALEVGYHPQIILSGRRINDSMGEFIAEKTLYHLAKKNISARGAKIGVLGLTFKENCPDLRNTKVITIIEHLKAYDCIVTVNDEWADPRDAEELYKLKISSIEDIVSQDALIIAVAHDCYREFKNSDWVKMIKPKGVFIDVKSIYDNDFFLKKEISYWRL